MTSIRTVLLPVLDHLARQARADLVQRLREGVVVARRARGSVCEQQHGVVRRALAVDRDPVERRLDRGTQELLRLAGLERVVGRHDGEHRRERRVDHPGALGHAAHRELARLGDATLARVSVVRIASAASAPPRGERSRGAAQSLAHLPQRQVDADHAGREDEHLFHAQVEEPGRLGGGGDGVDVAALAGRRVGDARADHDRGRRGVGQVLLRDLDRRRLHAVRREHARANGRHERADEREVAVRASDPALDAAGDEALGGSDAHTKTPGSRKPSDSGSPSARLAFWIACPAAPLPRLSSAQMTIARPVERSMKRPISAASVPCTRASSGAILRQHGDRVGARVGLLEPLPQVVLDRVGVAGSDEAAPHGQQVRDEAHGKAERLLDLGRVLVPPDPVRRQVLEHVAGVRLRLERPSGARDARLRVDDHAVAVERRHERKQGEENGRRVAAGSGHEPPGRRQKLRKRVLPVAQVVGPGMDEAVPRVVRERVAEPVTAGEVDDDALHGRIERGGVSWPRQRKTTSAPLASASSFGTKAERRRRRGVPRQTRVERARGLPRQRVRPERDQVELRMREHPVERLLSGVAGGTGDRGKHGCVLCRNMRMNQMDAHLVLEDGTLFRGRSVGSPGTAAGEICFTTAMAGYEEVVTRSKLCGPGARAAPARRLERTRRVW